MGGWERGPFLVPFTGILVPLALSSWLLLLPLIAFCYVFVLVYVISGRDLDAAVIGIAGTSLLAPIPAAWWLERREQRRKQRREAEFAERRRAEEFAARAQLSLDARARYDEIIGASDIKPEAKYLATSLMRVAAQGNHATRELAMHVMKAKNEDVDPRVMSFATALEQTGRGVLSAREVARTAYNEACAEDTPPKSSALQGYKA